MNIDAARWGLGLALSVVIASCPQQPTPTERSSHLEPAARIARIPLPGSGYIYDVAVAGGAVWVTSQAGLFRIDPVTSEAVNVLPHDYLFRVFPGYGDLWITTGEYGRVLRFDSRTSEVTAEIDVGAGPVTYLAMSDDAVWVSAVSDLVRLDPATNDVVARLRSHATFGDVAFGEHGLWVIAGANEEGAVWRIDPATSEVQQRIPLANPSFWNQIEAGDGAIWVISSPVAHRSGDPLVFLHRIDPSTGAITAEVPLGNGVPADKAVSLATLEVSEGSVWILIESENLVLTVDPADLSEDETVEGISAGSSDVGPGMTIGAGAVWVTAPEALTRVAL